MRLFFYGTAKKNKIAGSDADSRKIIDMICRICYNTQKMQGGIFMKKQNKKIILLVLFLTIIIFIIGLIVGLVLIFSASSIGENAGNSFIRSRGGTYFPDQVVRIIENTIISYQLGGLILSFISGIGLLICLYALFKKYLYE